MNKKKYSAVALGLVALTASALAFQQRTQSASSAQIAHELSNRMPEHIPYGILFQRIYTLEKEAEKAEREGRHDSAVAFRSWIRQSAELNDEQARIVSKVAEECEHAVEKVDRRAKVILDARRAYYKDGKLMPGQELLPPSEQLAVLQRERNATILQCRDHLRANLGERDFARFAKFVSTNVRPSITVTPANQTQPVDQRP